MAVAEIALHVLEDADPAFAKNAREGDIVVAGWRFGRGKHHDRAVEALRELGVSAFLARSLDPMFQRVAVDRGIPALVCAEIPSKVESGDLLEFDLRMGSAANLTRDLPIIERPVPDILLSILEAGGVEQYTLRRLGVAG